jgi:hypothetical protein
MSVTPESFQSFCKDHLNIPFATSHETVVDEIMMEVSSEQPSGINENSGGEEIMQVLECAPVNTSNGEEKIDFTSKMESENKSELSIKKPIDQQQKKMDETHRLFRKYTKAMDSLQNAMEVMEAKWTGKCPDSVYYSDESSDDSSIQVTWATGMNTEIALRNGEADWVIFKKKQARVQYAKQRWMDSLKSEQCDPRNFKTVKTDLPVEISYTSSDTGNQEGLTSGETCFSEVEEEVEESVKISHIMGSILLPNNITRSSSIGNLFLGNNQKDQSFQDQNAVKTPAYDSDYYVTTPTSVNEGIT